jgi:enamine deaminase RidA (YjgF/YER057c/UK114 family)
MTTDTSAAERARGAVSTASDEGKHVAGVAADEAKSVASEAKDQFRGLAEQTMGDVQGQVEDQTRQQKDRLAGTLATFGSDLGSMAEDRSGLAADVAHAMADRARALSQHLDRREPRELLDDVRRFARQRPGTFLIGALAAGVVVGRFARSTKDAATAADAPGTEVAPSGMAPAAPATASGSATPPTVAPAGDPYGGPTV